MSAGQIAPIAVGKHDRRRRRLISGWLFAIAAMVFLMVVLGGATRLTHSGLSMVEWRPVTGWLPPLSEAEWEQAFTAYQRYPEFQKLNPGMTLAGYKRIFWLEYIHRLTGRLLGVAFFVPLVVFAVRGWLDRPLAGRLGVIFGLGALQGVLGWVMVRSGLVSHPDVSQYRLVAHLGLALVIYGAIIWVALGLLLLRPAGAVASGQLPARTGLAWPSRGLCALVFATVLSGGFVAGIDAGFAFNTFPLMDGALIPAGLMPLQPWYLSLFEDVATVQFTHRVLATLTGLAIIAFWLRARRRAPTARSRWAVDTLAAVVGLQYALGVATLLMIVPVPLGVAHQAGAVALWTVALWATFEFGNRP